ncbi:MAG: AAA family ATPase [Symbiobacteriaceae bacterium]|nr:AAA family ATPase [Symbiobacteriaceae bacterium]
MGRIIAIVNQKGGVGKTTTAVNLSAALAEVGEATLLVDLDPQGNSTSGLGIRKEELDACCYNLLLGQASAEGILCHTAMPCLKLIPATMALVGAEIELVDLPQREFRLQEGLAPIAAGYDYIIIDCPPSLGLLTLNALCAANSVLIPVQCEFYALEGVSQLLRTIRLVQQHLNPALEIEGALLTMFDGRLNLNTQVAAEIRRHFGDKVYRAQVPRNVRLSEAPSHGMPVLLYDSRSRGAICYRDLAQEVRGHAR